MAKTKMVYMCQECGYDSPKWLGRCPGCQAWNTFVEERIEKNSSGGGRERSGGKPLPITQVDCTQVPRQLSGIGEFDRVLGGGIVPGSLILIGGDPGIGKSTLLLQVAVGVSQHKGEVLYVSGEESAEQIRMRAERLGHLSNKLWVMTETNLDQVIQEAGVRKPGLLVIDSIQTMFSDDLPAAPGSVGQVRDCTAKLLRMAKQSNIPVAIIGHVTKEGNIAGPRLLEHMVDVVLYFEGERSYAFRVLRSMKNRFGSTAESGIFSMEERGLEEVGNPSAMLLSERPLGISGSAVMAYLEGVRPLLIEVQALVTPTYFGMPRRTADGFDYNRLILLLAVLEKRMGQNLSGQDVYLNAVGGMRVSEPAADLAVLLSVASGFRNVPLDPHTVVMGEVGMAGEIRRISRVAERISEGVALGFQRFVIPAGNLSSLKNQPPGATIVGVSNVAEAMKAVLA